MIRFVWTGLRHRAGRSIALMLGMVLAITGFTVLSGSSATSQLGSRRTVQESARSLYQIVVRPKGNRLPLETGPGLVRPNAFSGQYGGITLAQWQQLRQIPDVEVAAPVATLGYTSATQTTELDITDAVDRSLTSQVIRVSPQWSAEHGLSRFEERPEPVYVTRNRLAWRTPDRQEQARYFVPRTVPGSDTDWVVTFSDGIRRRLSACGVSTRAYEIAPSGAETAICWPHGPAIDPTSSTQWLGTTAMVMARLRDDGRFETSTGGSEGGRIRVSVVDRLRIPVAWPVTYLVEGVDPDQEARLTGLDAAVVSGRALAAGDRVHTGEVHLESAANAPAEVPVLVPDRAGPAEQVRVTAQRVDLSLAALNQASQSDGSGDELAAARAVSAPVRRERTLDEVQRDSVAHRSDAWSLGLLARAGPVEYDRRPDATLVPRPRPGTAAETLGPVSYRESDQMYIPWESLSWSAFDTQYRDVTLPRQLGTIWPYQYVARRVGVFDPGRLRQVPELAELPMEAYRAPAPVGADARSRALLGGGSLTATGNPGGYLSAAPAMLTTLDAVRTLLPGQAAAPISQVRVRVAGVHRYDDETLARVQRTAVRIAATTGLEVDVLLGASPTPVTVALGKGTFGRPDLLLSEGWFRKGVAAHVVNAIEHRGPLLIGLILVVCALFLGNAVASGVRARRRDLAVLACLGWPTWRLFAVLIGEVVAVGVAAGVASAALTLPVAHLAGLSVPAGYALLAIPAALAIAVLAGTWPALHAATRPPAAAVRPSVRSPRRPTRGHRTLLGVALTTIARSPGRTLVAASALAVGVCALTVLIAVNGLYQQALTGTHSVLGSTILDRISTIDRITVVTTILLGVVALADVVYLGIRERTPELAALRSLGWSGATTARLITYECLGVGLLGSALGIGAGLVVVTRFAERITEPVLTACVAAAAAGILLSIPAALVPAWSFNRSTVTGLLSRPEATDLSG